MANVKTLQRSFAGGEVTPEFFGRIDDAVYASGAAKMRNMIALPHGPVTNRPGFAFVREVKTSAAETRLIPFTFSTTQTYAVEVGAGYFRFHTEGATLLAGTPPAYLGATAYVVGDLVASAGVKYYCVAPTTGNAPPNATYWYALPASGVYEVPNPYAADELFDIHYVQSADVLTLVHPNHAPRELRRYAATNWRLELISFSASISPPAAPAVGVTFPAGGSAYVCTYVVTALTTDLSGESVASAATSVNNNLFSTGAYNTITWAAVSGAGAYNVYKLSGGLYGFIGQTLAGTVTLVDDNISADVSKTPPVYDAAFTGAGNYPAAVSYFEQRRCFAGTTNKPQNLWMTKSGTESSLAYSLPTRDDDRIAFRVAAREANIIRHIVPLGNLLLLTSAAEWRVTSINTDAITPSSVSVRPQSYIGANNVQPAIINNNLLYAAARGGHVREAAYNWQASGYVTGDVSLRAPHLFDGLDIVDMAYAKAPQPLCWFVSSNGKLLGLTYIPEQQIGAWHQHDTTDGVFESVCVVAEGGEDALYAIVKRTVNGSDVRYVERMASRLFIEPEDAFFVDSGATFNGANTTATTVTVTGGVLWDQTEDLTITASAALFAYPAQTDEGDAIVFEDADGTLYRLTIVNTSSTTVATAYVDKVLGAPWRASATANFAFARKDITGLDHLEGETVSVLADAAVHPQRVVTSGKISLDSPAVKAQIGLPIEADLQTLPLAMQIDGAFGQGRHKNVNKVWLRVYRSSGIFVGPTSDKLTEAKQRTTEPYGAPPALKSEEIMVLITPSWDDSGQVYVRQADPLPLTIVSMTLEVAIGG